MNRIAVNNEKSDSSWFASGLGLITRSTLRFPRLTLVLAAMLAVAALGITAARLGLRTSRLDLLDPHSRYNQRWIKYLDEFGHADDAIVAIQGDTRQAVEETADEIAAELQADTRLFQDVLHKVDLRRLRAKGLYYLTVEQLNWLDRRLAEFAPVLQGDWSRLQAPRRLTDLANQLSDSARRAAAELEMAECSRTLLGYLRGQPDAEAHFGDLRQPTSQLKSLKTHYLTSEDGRFGWILVRPAISGESFDRGAEAIERLRDIVARTNAARPHVEIGLTGLPVLEYDEMVASQRGSLQAALLSLAGVAILFVVGLGSLRHPLLSIATLIIALAWTLGYITLAVGHLNILSMAFGVILIGLGIDFGVHYVARYLELRPKVDTVSDALVQTARGVGPGVIAGGVTTALAFFTAGLTRFTGVAELGLIAGGGVLLCVAATILLLPPLILLLDRHRDVALLPRPLNVGRGVHLILKAPYTVLLASLLVAGAIGVGSVWIKYDHNLLNLQSPQLESVRWERRLLEETDHSAWFAVSICNSRQELFRRKKQFESMADSVQDVEEIASLTPAEVSGKQPLVARIHLRLSALPERPPVLPVDSTERLGSVLAHVESAAAKLSHQADSLGVLTEIRDRIRNLPAQEAYKRVAAFQQDSAAALLAGFSRLRAASETDLPSEADLPAALRRRFSSPQGRYLLKVYSRANIWNMDALERFVQDVRRVDPDATGQPLQTYEASRQMVQSYFHAALYSLIAVCMVLMLDFGKLGHVLLALAPLALGMLLMFGLLGWLGVALNPANMIVLPLILGIGVDDGVHVVHDFRRQRGRFRLSGSTATAIVMTSLTTMVGFGSLMTADHLGLQSLGRVITIGVACCLLASLVALPALLRILSGSAESDPPPEPKTASRRTHRTRPCLVSASEPAGWASVPESTKETQIGG